MNYKDIIKRQSFIIAASIIVMAVILIGTSYALFTKNDQSEEQVVSSGTLQISYAGSVITTTGGSNDTELEPMTESDALAAAPYKIEVKNNGTLAMSYNIFIFTVNGNTLPHSYVSVKEKNGTTKALTSLTKANTETDLNKIKYKLSDNAYTVQPGETNTHEVYVWVDDARSDDNIDDKVVVLKMSVEGDASTPIDYKYWNDGYSNHSISATSMSATNYTNYADLVTASSNGVFIRTTMSNGSVGYHEPCLYLGSTDKYFCLGHNYWQTVTGSQDANAENATAVGDALKSAMENDLSTLTTSCYIDHNNNNSVSCSVNSTYCNVTNVGYATCTDGTNTCTVYENGNAKCK